MHSRTARFALLLLAAPIGGAAAQPLRAESPEWDLHVAVLHNDLARVRMRLDGGVDVNVRDGIGYTPLSRAAQRGHADVARLLLDRGAEPGWRTARGYSALHIAARWVQPEVAGLLLERGAEPDARDGTEATPLMIAASRGDLETAGLLLARGAAIEARDRDGRTALMHAVDWNEPEMVRWLLERGADVSAASREGHSVLDIARWIGRDAAEVVICERLGCEPAPSRSSRRVPEEAIAAAARTLPSWGPRDEARAADVGDLCTYVGNRTPDHEPLSPRYPYRFHRALFEAAGAVADTGRAALPMQIARMRRLWQHKRGQLICNNLQFSLVDGSLIKYAVVTGFDRFVNDVVLWGVGREDHDNGGTVLDFLLEETDRTTGTPIADKLQVYYDRMRRAGYRHRSELP